MILAIIMTLCVVTILVSGWFEKDLLGISKSQWVLLVSLLYLIIAGISWSRSLNYFYFSDEGDKILIRYYPIRPIVRKKKAIQIPNIALSKFETGSSLLGLRRTITLYQKVKGSVAKYPPIGITSLHKNELEALKKQLSIYVR